MAIVQGATFTGVPVEDVRPGKIVRQGVAFENIAKDQACAYESITGIKVPASSTIAATPHVHDGTDGPIIPIPLCSVYLNALLYPSASVGIRSNGGWSPVCQQIQFVPAGVTKVRCWVAVDTYATLSVLRATVYDSSLAQFGDGDFVVFGVVGGVALAYCDVQCNASAHNIFRLEYRAAHPTATLPRPGDRIYSFTVVPYVGESSQIPALTIQGTTSTSILVPSSTQYVGSVSSGYHPSQEAAYDDDRPISGYMVRSAAYNDGQLYELATGQPYSGVASATWAGHCHGAATSVTTTSAHGAVIDQPLLAINYGVRRTYTGKANYRFDDDEAEGSAADWSGRVWCSQLTTATGTSYQTLGSYPFHMPATLAANAHTGAGLKLKFAALIHVNATHITTGTIRAQIASDTLAATGTATALTSSGSGLQIVSGTIDYHGSADIGRTGARAMLLVDAKRNVNYVASVAATFGILSCCLYLEA